ncbi:MAG TPA: hypothetical protein VF989_13370 [Polyangiaceae bacterium]|jgi:hypothetical protein
MISAGPVTFRFCAALGALVGAAACSHPIQSKLEGRWLGDAVENFDDPVVASATGWVKGTSFEFAGPNLTIAIPGEEPRTGSYRVAGARKSLIKLAITRADGGSDRAELRMDSDNSMRWMLDNSRAVVLRRDL